MCVLWNGGELGTVFGSYSILRRSEVLIQLNAELAPLLERVFGVCVWV